MKLIISSILLSTSIAIVCAAPGVVEQSSVVADVVPSVSEAVPSVSEAVSSVAEAVPSVNPREEAWAKMKVALPDGVFPEDRLTSDRLQHAPEERIVPMIVMSNSDFPLSYLMRKPLYKHQRFPLAEEGLAYKHMGAAANEETFDPLMITPLLPEAQEELIVEHELEQEAEEAKADAEEFLQKGHRYKNLVAITDTGAFEHIQLPRAGKSSLPETLEVEEEVLPQGVSEKKVVGIDKMGNMRYIDVPYYNRVKNEEEI
ncbi:unnamed protein product [Mucor hiemalis]